MSGSAKSVFCFGLYLTIVGEAVFLVPNLILGLFGLPAPTDPWIRVVGVLILVIAFYCIQAARAELTAFFRWTVYARGFVFLSFLVLISLRLAPPILLILGSADLLGAVWTALTLRVRQSRTAQGG